MKTVEEKTFIDTLIDKLNGVQSELEDFKVQISLGKSEAIERYENMKKNFHVKMSEVESYLKKERTNLSATREKLIESIQHLLFRITLGKIETKDEFRLQSEKIKESIHKLELALEREQNSLDKMANAKLKHELEMFKVKLAMIASSFDLKKEKLKEDIITLKKEFGRKLEHIKINMEKKKENISDQWDCIKDDIGDVYKHLKALFV